MRVYVVRRHGNFHDLIWYGFSPGRPCRTSSSSSGYSENAIHDSFVLLRGLPFLQKPFGLGALARKVREVLDKA